LGLSQVSRVVPRAAAVVERGCRSAPLSAEPLEHLGQRGARPGIGPCDGEAVAVGQRRGAVDEVLGRGSERSNGYNLARAPANAASAHPAQAVAAGGGTQGETPPPPGGLEAHARASYAPVADGVGTRGLLEPELGSQATQDPTDRAQAEAPRSTAWPAEPNDRDFRPRGHGLRLALKLAQAAGGRFAVWRGLSARSFAPREWLTQVPVVVAALLGLGFPLVTAGGDLAQWPPRLRALTSPQGGRAGGEGVMDMSGEARAMGAAVPLESACATAESHAHAPGETRLANRLAATPRAGEPGRFWGAATAPLGKTPCGQQGICGETACLSCRGGGRCQVEHERFSLCYSPSEAKHGGPWQSCQQCRAFWAPRDDPRYAENPINGPSYCVGVEGQRGPHPGHYKCSLQGIFRQPIRQSPMSDHAASMLFSMQERSASSCQW
jgi:hypothetical protein